MNKIRKEHCYSTSYEIKQKTEITAPSYIENGVCGSTDAIFTP